MSKRYDATSKALVAAGPADWLSIADLGPHGAPLTLEPTDLSTVTASVDAAIRVAADSPGSAISSSFPAARPTSCRGWRATMASCMVDLVLLSPKADRPEYNGELKVEYERPNGPRVTLQINYTVVRMWEYPSGQYLAAGPSLVPLAVLGNDVTEANAPEVLEQVARRLDAVAPPEQANELRAATEVMMPLAFPKDQVHLWFQGRSKMGMEGSAIYQDIVLVGEAKGARKSIVRLGRRSLGAPSKETLAKIEEITDLDRLERLLDEVAQARTWDDLLAMP